MKNIFNRIQIWGSWKMLNISALYLSVLWNVRTGLDYVTILVEASFLIPYPNFKRSMKVSFNNWSHIISIHFFLLLTYCHPFVATDCRHEVCNFATMTPFLYFGCNFRLSFPSASRIGCHCLIMWIHFVHKICTL